MATLITRTVVTACALCLVFGCTHSPEPAASGGPPLDDAVRQKVLDATLEIVPAEARTSVVGTAFSIGNGQFATAAHTLENFVGSNYPKPMFRARNGARYQIDRILKFTNEGDGELAVVTLKDAPPIQALERREAPLSPTEPFWFVGRRMFGGIAIEPATVRPAHEQPDNGKEIVFSGNAVEGFSGGPVVDQNGKVVGLIARGDPAQHWARTTLMAELDFAGPTLQVHATALLGALGATRSPRRVDPKSLTVQSSFEQFSAALRDARKALYREILFDPDERTERRFIFEGARSPVVCQLLNGTECPDVTGDSTAAEVWELPGESSTLQFPLAPVRGTLPVYSIHGAILIRDVTQSRPVARLFSREGKHWDLAKRCFEDPGLRFHLASNYDELLEKTPLAPNTETYPDTHDRQWTFRSWKLGNEDFLVVSLGRETDDGHSYLVLATVVPASQLDGATVLLKYVANFTFSARGGVIR